MRRFIVLIASLALCGSLTFGGSPMSLSGLVAVAAINQAPSANFTYAPSSPVSGQPITFTNTSADPDGDPMQFWWDFGDGQTSADGHPTISYAAPGTYTVELMATDNQHPWVTVTRTIVVGQPSQTSAPVVSVTSVASSRPAGSTGTATFSVHNGNSTLRTYALVASSSNTAVVPDPADPPQLSVGPNSSGTVTVTYQVSASAAAGTTSVVRLQATDSGDATKTHSASFTHTTQPAQGNQAPSAAFTYAPSSPVSGQAITFTNTSTDPEGDPMQFWWTFGDGQDSAAAHPTISYAAPGTYTVELMATDNQHPWVTSQRTIVVGQPGQIAAPVVSVTSAPPSRPPGATGQATFSVRNDNGTPRTYALVAGSSNTAVVPDPADPAQIEVGANSAATVTVSYQVSAAAASGSTSMVRLQATDTADATKTHAASFTHTTQAPQGNQAPSATFTWTPSNPVSGQSVTFTNTSTDPEGDPMQFWWTFGDGQDSAAASPTISYAAPGTYTVELMATDNQHPWVTSSRTIVIGQPGQIAAPVVSVTSAESSRPAGSTGQATFSVRNDNGAPRTYALAATSSNPAVIADPADPARIDVGANSAATVTVSYQVSASAAAGSTSVVRLQATDTSDATKTHAASFTHTTQAAAATILAPGVDLLSYPESLPPGSTGTGLFRVTNRSSEARGFNFRGISAHPDVIPDPADPAPISSIPAGGYADVTVTYHVPPDATVGSTAAIQLEANDSLDPSKTNYKTFYHTTSAPSVVAPVVTVVSAQTPAPAGSAMTARFSVRNPNGSARTYAFQATSENHSVVADPADPASLLIGAGDTAVVSISYTVAASAANGSTALIRLAAADAADTSRWHAATFTHTTAAIAAPTVTATTASATTPPGRSATAVFTIRNNNAARRSYTFVAASSNTAVVADPGDPAGFPVDGGATGEVTVHYQVAASAAANSSTSITLEATDTASASARHSAVFTHTTAAVVAAPAIAFPNGSVYGLRNVTYSVPMEVTNVSNTRRTLCFAAEREPGASGDVDNVTTAAPVVPGCLSFEAGEMKTLPVTYTMANSNWDGDSILAAVTASDQLQPSSSTRHKFKVTVLMAADSPAPAALQAGKTHTYRYSFYNQDKFSTTHTYHVTSFISGAAVFRNVTMPSQITIPAGEWRSVDVSFTVPPELAGQSGALTVTLQDVNPLWVDRVGTSMSSVTAVNVLPPSVSLPDGWVHGSRNQSYVARLVVRNNTAAARRLCFDSERAPGSGGTPDTVTVGDPAVPPCQRFEAEETKELQIRYTMADSDWDGDGVQARITARDEEDPAVAAMAWTKISVLMDAEPPPAAALQAGGRYTQRYRFYNRDRLGTPHTYTVTHTATPGLFESVTHPATVAIPAGSWGDVDVAFTLPAGSAGQIGALEVQLQDVDPHWSERIGRALAAVSSIEVLPPSIQLPDGWRHGLRGQSYSVRLVATNNTAAPRTLCFSSERAPGSGGNADNVTTGNPAVPPCQLFGAHETRTLPVTYTMANSDWDGDGTQVTIKAWDAHDGRTVTADFKISVLMRSNPPPPATLMAGETHTLRYGFYNQDRFGMAHTYRVTTSVSGDAIFQGIYAPSTVEISAGTWGEVAVAFTIPAGSAGRAGTLTVQLNETEPTWPDRIGVGATFVTSGTISLANPTVSAPAGETAAPGSQRTATFQVRNNSSASRTFSFSANSSNTSVVPDPLDPETRPIGAGATESVTVQYTVFGSAASGSSAAITLAATDTAETARSGSGAFVVTVATAPVASDKFTGYSIIPSNLDRSTGIPIQLGAGHFDQRQYRQWVGWQGCAPSSDLNGDPDILYTADVPQFAARYPGKLYIFLDEPAHGTPWNHRTGSLTGCKQVTPEQYARAYHAFVQSVRAADPTARFSPGGFEQVRANGEAYPTAFVEYAAEFAQKYQEIYGSPAPVDEWRFHVYWEWWPNPADIAYWREKADVAIRFANDRQRPVVLGIGYPWQEQYDARMLDGMSNMFAYLKDHSGVASVFWFSYDEYHDGYNRLTTHTEGGALTRTLTPLGERYRALIQGLGTPSTGSPVAVTPDGMNAFVTGGVPGTQKFRVQNVGAAQAVYTLTQSCSDAVTNCGTPSPAQVTLAAGETSGEVSVSYDMAASGSGWLTLNAVQQGVASVNDSGSYHLTAASASANTFDLAPHNGENVDTAQYAGTLSQRTPGYISMDVERAVTLFYSSAQADPRGLVQVDVTDATPPQAYSILLKTESGAPVVLDNGATENFYSGGSGGVTRLAAQFDPAQFHSSGLPAGARAYRVQVVVRRWNGGVAVDSQPQWARVLIVNERESPYGRGWSVSGLQRIHIQSDGSLVLTGGDGTALYYARPAGCGSDCTYVRPRGEWSEVQFRGAEFIRTYPGGDRAIFDASGYLSATEDRAGNRTAFAYDGNRLSRITDPVGMYFHFNYGQWLASIVDPNTRTTHITHDGDGRLIGAGVAEAHDAVPAPAMSRITYDARYRLRGWADRADGDWSVDYDHAGGLALVRTPAVAADGQVRTLDTTLRSLPAVVLPPAGMGTALGSAAPNVAAAAIEISSTNPRGATTWTAVDRFGAAVRVRDALQRVTRVDRDAESRVVRKVTNAGHTVRYDWEGHLLRTVTDETLGTAVNYEYEPGGWRRIKRVHGDAPETIFEYETGPHNATNPGAGTDTVKVRRTGDTFAITKYTYDTRGVLRSVTDPEGHGMFYAYDESRSWNLTLQSSGAVGSAYRRGERYVLDAYGRIKQTYSRKQEADGPSREEEKLVRTDEYDRWNRVTASIDAANRRTTFDFTGERGLYQVTDPKQQVYTWNRNALGWPETEVDPRGKAQRYTYDSTGNVTSHTNRRNQTIAFGYDLADRVTHRDADGARTTWTYHPDDRRITIANAESTDEIVTDAAGRVDLTRIQRGSLSVVLDETANRRGQREELTITGPFAARTIGYAYDERHQFYKLRDFNGDHAVISRDGDGLARHTYPNPRFGIIHEQTSSHNAGSNNYTGIGGTDRDTYVGLGNPGSGFRRDERGRLQARYPAATPTRYWKYRYDDVTDALKGAEEWDRPTEVCYHDADRGYYCEAEQDFPNPNPDPLPRPRRVISYAWDATGNPAFTGTVVHTGNRLMSHNGFNMEYDDDGNMVRKSNAAGTFQQTLTWNSLSQLVSVTTNQSTINYFYDGQGRRVRRGDATQYIYDDEDLLMELSSGTIQREYVHYPGTDRPHSLRDWTNGANGATFYYALQDPGHVVGLIDAGGIVVNEYRYDPFGTPLVNFPVETVGNPLRFAAREWDGDSRLYYMRNRWYDPQLERFVSEDPLGLEGGINPYVYAANSPTTFTDPLGLTAQVTDECSVGDAQIGKCAMALLGLVVRGVSRSIYIDVSAGTFGRGNDLRGVGGPRGSGSRPGWGAGGRGMSADTVRKGDYTKMKKDNQCVQDTMKDWYGSVGWSRASNHQQRNAEFVFNAFLDFGKPENEARRAGRLMYTTGMALEMLTGWMPMLFQMVTDCSLGDALDAGKLPTKPF